MTDTTQRLIDLTARRFKVEPGNLKPTDDIFESLKINSYQALELLTELEMEFDIELPDYEVQGVRSFAALAGKIDKRR